MERSTDEQSSRMPDVPSGDALSMVDLDTVVGGKEPGYPCDFSITDPAGVLAMCTLMSGHPGPHSCGT